MTGVKYEDEHAIFMLESMFNQFPKAMVADMYMKESKKNFDVALDKLISLQKTNNSQPHHNHGARNGAGNRLRKLMEEKKKNLKVKQGTIKYTQLSEKFNFEKVVKWKTFDIGNDDHLRLLKGMDDPLTLDNFLETIEEDPSIDIVQLPCATTKVKCNFFKVNIVQSLMSKPECPLCHTYYPIPGTQPSGTMTTKVYPDKNCQGYYGDGVIEIVFNFPSGTQGPNHRNPGTSFSGTTRYAYLPHVDDGKLAVKLLEKAFQRGELFTVGRSLTNNSDNVVTFGSIHLKTAVGGGPQAHGWPDNTYFSRLQAECAAKMIFHDDQEDEMMGWLNKKDKTSNTII
mmetsp:Transcript_6309/g.7945  ORF Transcript_6309/g.7945 Transcript_6309/m.7945 type:complete len:341 (-) Transcript_6309:283-1305(-)